MQKLNPTIPKPEGPGGTPTPAMPEQQWNRQYNPDYRAPYATPAGPEQQWNQSPFGTQAPGLSPIDPWGGPMGQADYTGGRGRGPLDGYPGPPAEGFQQGYSGGTTLTPPVPLAGGGGTDAWSPTTTKQAQWEHAKKFPGAGANVQQQWLRDPSWGGHVIWNQDLGFQDFPSMAKLYSEAGGPVSQEQMMGWGLTPQLGSNWREYFPERQTKSERGWQPSGGGTSGNLGTGGTGIGGYNPTTGWTEGWTEGGQMEQTQFPYPQQWGTASNVMTRFAEGLPTDTGAWWEAQQAPFERRISDQAKQVAEQMGLGGLRYSTPMTGQIADITGRESANLFGQLAERQLGLTEAAKDRGLQAAGGLTGLGQQYLNAPQEWAQQMYGMGSGMTALGQGGIDRSRQEWMRTIEENNPWLAQAMGFGGMSGATTPQQWQQSPWTQFMNMLFG